MSTSLDEIVANFDLLEEWDDRYRYLIELGRSLAPLPEEAHNEANKVRGCASQVWLDSQAEAGPGPQTRLSFRGDSDAHIVRGLVALTLAIYSGRTAAEIIATDAFATFEKLGLAAHLTPQRSNGVRSMIERIKSDAREAAAS
ncbi:MAG: cysteine desulfuration protein SufE [Methylobacterium sp.]|uniref:SufE family protein n=1 Tax=Bosea sp. (in: a-proteobacteria) TaxID=1871050 RepID=UPI001DA2F3ED|nr:SufE family protein [Bosea sp. (in: a-proteobacteria)]MBA4268496.1 cysteine desulfuration protein SufE [Methylobacterium sp.]MBA4335346.1 cysteine desulfuration protein SufE [Methylobacterium sp.]WRH58046.1 MAG: SufE family protein [Bosea sp. (in: a-proteobacteria)]